MAFSKLLMTGLLNYSNKGYNYLFIAYYIKSNISFIKFDFQTSLL